jgi:hypothetical protein
MTSFSMRQFHDSGGRGSLAPCSGGAATAANRRSGPVIEARSAVDRSVRRPAVCTARAGHAAGRTRRTRSGLRRLSPAPAHGNAHGRTALRVARLRGHRSLGARPSGRTAVPRGRDAEEIRPSPPRFGQVPADRPESAFGDRIFQGTRRDHLHRRTAWMNTLRLPPRPHRDRPATPVELCPVRVAKAAPNSGPST